MNKGTQILIGTGIGVGIVGIIVLIVLIMGNLIPFISTEPLQFYLKNYDDVNEHEVKVEILDSKDKCIFNETYILNPEAEIKSPKITRQKGTYLFKVTLDDEIIETFEAELSVSRDCVNILLYDYFYINGEGTIPITIGQRIS